MLRSGLSQPPSSSSHNPQLSGSARFFDFKELKEPSPYEASRDRRIRPIAKLLKSSGTWWKTTSALLASNGRTARIAAAALALIATGLVFGVAQTAPGWMVLDNIVRDITARFAADTPSRAHPELAIISITNADLESRPFQRPVDRSLIGDLVTAADKSGAALIALVDPIEHATLPNADAALLASITTAKADVIAVVREDGEPFARSYLTGVQIALPGVPDTGSIALPPLPTRSEALAPRLAESVLGRGVETHHLGTPLDPVWRTDAGNPAILRLTVDEALNALDMDGQFLKDRIVLVGVDVGSSWNSGAGIPGSPILSRAEIVAQQTAQLLDGRHVETSPAWASWVLAAFAGLLAAALCILSRSRWISAALTMVGVSSACFAASVLLWSVFSLSLSPVAAVLGVAVTTFLCEFILGAHHRILRHRAKRTIGERFGNSDLKPSAADKLLLGLDGETRVVSVLEMRGPSFAATADSRTASETLPALSAFCDGLTSIVDQFGGTIETLKPGRMTVVFGAPSLQPDHAMQALKAAREIADFCVRFGAQRASLGINAGAFRIGVHTGPATVGAFSASGDKNYAAVGLTPDTADRLAHLGKSLGTVVCCTDSCLTAARSSGDGALDLRPVGEINLPGHVDPVSLYEPLTAVQAALPQTLAYMKAFRALCTGAPDSERLFRDLLQRDPDDAVVALHLGRLRAGETGSLIRRAAVA